MKLAESPASQTVIVCWGVEIYEMTTYVFATTKAKAQWIAVRGYREAGFGRSGQWPPARAFRAPRYDACTLKDQPGRCWGEDYVMENTW